MLATDDAKVKSPMQDFTFSPTPRWKVSREEKEKGKRKRNFRIDPRQNKEVDIHTVSSSQDQNIIVNSTEY